MTKQNIEMILLDVVDRLILAGKHLKGDAEVYLNAEAEVITKCTLMLHTIDNKVDNKMPVVDWGKVKPC